MAYACCPECVVNLIGVLISHGNCDLHEHKPYTSQIKLNDITIIL